MFVYLFLVFLASFFCFLCFVSSNLFVWWSVFLMMTILFVMLNKSSGSYSSLFNYFVIQESLGLFFLIFCFSVFQLFIVMMKIGVAPLHFWVFSVTNNVLGYGLLWFLTFQKLPFLFVLLQLFSSLVVYFLIFGFIFCYFQIFSLKNFKNMMIISSTESFSWIVLGCSLSFFNSIVLFFYYFFLMLFLINKFGKFNYNFIMLETVLVFLNIPFSVSFFVKIFSLGVLFNLDSFFILLVLFLMFLSVVSFSFWLINISTKTKEDFSLNSSSFYFLIYPMMLFLII